LSKIILVTGPARSGKSEWAETLALQSGKTVVYVATAYENLADLEWCDRLTQHKLRRSQNWLTLEVPVALGATVGEATAQNCLLVDSLGTWVANLLEQDEVTWQEVVQDFLATAAHCEGEMIFVAEETGWGVVPAYPIGRIFRDRLGSLVRRLGTISHTVYLVTGGHVLNLSALGSPLPELK